MVLQHSFNQQKSRRFGLLSWSRAVPSKGSALPRAIAGGQSCVKDSRSFSPSRRWNIPPSLVPSRVLAESQGKIDLVERWQVRDGFGRKAVVTPAVGRVRWTEFFVFFVTHRTGEGNGHIYASGWDELWDVRNLLHAFTWLVPENLGWVTRRRKELDQHVFHFKYHMNQHWSLAEPLWFFPQGSLQGSAPTSPKAAGGCSQEVIKKLWHVAEGHLLVAWLRYASLW